MIDSQLHATIMRAGIDYDPARRRYRKRLNRTVLDALRALTWPPGMRVEVWDTERLDLIARISGRSVSFNVYRRMPSGQWKRVSLGRYPALTPEQARIAARTKADEVAQGLDPADEKRKRRRIAAVESLTLRQAWTEYQKIIALKPRTIETYADGLKRVFGAELDQPIMKITCETVDRKVAEMRQRRSATLLKGLKTLRAICYFVNDRYERPDGQPLFARLPTSRLRRHWPRLKRRKTCLRPHQFKPFFTAVLGLSSERSNGLGEVARDFLIAALLTGMRKTALMQLRVADVDLQGRLFRVPETKNGDALELPFGEYLHELFKRRIDAAPGEFVFPGRLYPHFDDVRHWLARAEDGSGLKFCLHDLRRTFSTVAEELDISPITLKRLLSHRVPSNEEVTEGYVSLSLDRIRRAMQRIESFILSHAGIGGPVPVLSFPPRENIHSLFSPETPETPETLSATA